jgi:Fe-S-cluster containining protein
MNACELCAGACCESLMFGISSDPVSLEFYSARAAIFNVETITVAEVPCACPQLNASGRCDIYPNRPKACRTFKPGSTMCLAAVKRRRPDQADQILALIK